MSQSFNISPSRLLNATEKLTRELLNQIISGLTISKTGTVANNELSTSAVQANVTVPGAYWYATGTLSGGAYLVPANGALIAYVTGLVIAFKADTANGGAVNINVGTPPIGSVDLLDASGAELAAYAIKAGSIVVARYNGTAFQIISASNKLSTINAGSVGGTANALTLTLAATTLTLNHLEGTIILCQALLENTGAATLTITPSGGAALAATAILSATGVALGAREIRGVNHTLALMYVPSLTAFVALNLVSGKLTGGVSWKARNLICTKASATSVSITADEILLRDPAGTASYLATPVNLTAVITNAGANGLDTGAAANTVYYLWVIYNATTGDVAALISTGYTAPAAMPAGYIYCARVGAFVRAAGAISYFYQQGTNAAVLETVTALTGGLAAWISHDVSGFVPITATRVRGYLGVTAAGDARLRIAGSADATNMVGAQDHVGAAAAAATNLYYSAGSFDVPFIWPSVYLWHDTATAAAFSITGWSYDV